jgi:hypothetical protein
MAIWKLILVLSTTVLIGCAHSVAPSGQASRRCLPPPPDRQEATGDEQTHNVGPHGQTPFSARTMAFAEVLGLEQVLRQLATSRSGAGKTSVEFLLLRQQIDERLFLTTLQVSGSVAEIVCERDRADQAADRMDEVDASRVKGLTLASILIGGVASIVSGGLGLAGATSASADAASVSGGFLESIFGGTALFTKSSQEFLHERNVLREVWEDTGKRGLLPVVVWRFLHRQHPQMGATFREQLIGTWRQEGRLGPPGSKDEQRRLSLILGTGGRYTSPDLRIRAAMLEELQATINLINEELERFAHDVLGEMAG